MGKIQRKCFVAGRVRRCRELLATHKLEALIVTAPEDVWYLSGFSGDDSVVVVGQGLIVLVTDSRYATQARRECPGLAVHLRKGQMSAAVAEILSRWEQKRQKVSRVGIEADAVSVKQYQGYRKALSRKLRTAEGLVARLRQCKDTYEIEQLRKSIRVAENAMTAVLGGLRWGVSEAAVAGRLEYEMAQRGGGPAAFPSVVAFGAHAAEPHARPGKRRLGRDQAFLVDWGATVAATEAT